MGIYVVMRSIVGIAVSRIGYTFHFCFLGVGVGLGDSALALFCLPRLESGSGGILGGDGSSEPPKHRPWPPLKQ